MSSTSPAVTYCETEPAPTVSSIVIWASNWDTWAKNTLSEVDTASKAGRTGDERAHAIGGAFETVFSAAANVSGYVQRIFSAPMHACIAAIANADNIGAKIGYGILAFFSAFLLVLTALGMVSELLTSPLRALGRGINFLAHLGATPDGKAEFERTMPKDTASGPFGPLFDCFDNPFTADTECAEGAPATPAATPGNSGIVPPAKATTPTRDPAVRERH